MKRIFVTKKHEDFGWWGLVEKTAPATFEPLQGMGVAHDCLEHFPGDDGSIDHEFQALGCALWLIGTTGYFNAKGNTNPPAVHIASDLISQLWNHYINGTPMRPAQFKRMKYDDCVRETIEETIKGQKYDGILKDYPGDQKRYIESAKFWIQFGYNRAQRRYPNPHKVINVFQKIEEMADEAIIGCESEGQEFEIKYNVTKGDVSVKELQPESIMF